MARLRRVLAVAVALLALPWSLSAEVAVRPEQVKAAVARSVRLDEGVVRTRGLDLERFEEGVRAQIDDLADGLLPVSLYAHSEESAKSVLEAPLVLRYTDREYVDAAVRLHLLGIVGRLRYQLEYPPLAGAQRQAVEQNVEAFVSGLRESMRTRLVAGGLFSEEEITKHVVGIERDLRRRVGSPNSVWLTRALDQEQLASIVREFDARLADSVPRIRDRLSRGPADPKGQQYPLYAQLMRAQVLGEITQPAIGVLHKRTTDPKRSQMQADDYVPGYRAASRHLKEVEEQIRERSVPSSMPATRALEAEEPGAIPKQVAIPATREGHPRQ